jgi:kynureninase
MTTDFDATKAMFDLPAGVIYLDGNSLGPLPRGVADRVGRAITAEWGQMLITGWNKAGWMDMPARVGNRIARLIGAEPDHVVMGDTLSIKVYQALASALEMNPGRKVILSDTGNFPSDLYMADGLVRTLGQGYTLRTVAPDDVMDAIDETVAVTLITEVDYRTGRRHDMKAITARAHAMGALTVWDLAHSAGAVDCDLSGLQCRFRGGLQLQIPQLRPGRPGLHLCRPPPRRCGAPGAVGLAGPRRALCL